MQSYIEKQTAVVFSSWKTNAARRGTEGDVKVQTTKVTATTAPKTMTKLEDDDVDNNLFMYFFYV